MQALATQRLGDRVRAIDLRVPDRLAGAQVELAQLGGGGPAGDARRVDDGVDRPRARADLVDERAHRGQVGNVDGSHADLVPALGERPHARRRRRRRRVAGGQHQTGRVALRQVLGEREADLPEPAGDEHEAAVAQRRRRRVRHAGDERTLLGQPALPVTQRDGRRLVGREQLAGECGELDLVAVAREVDEPAAQLGVLLSGDQRERAGHCGVWQTAARSP